MEDRAILAVVVVFGILALSASAASIGDSRDVSSVGTGDSQAEGVGEGSGSGIGDGVAPKIRGGLDSASTSAVPFSPRLLSGFALLFVVVTVLTALYRYGLAGLLELARSFVGNTTAITLAVAVFGLVLYALSLFDDGATDRVETLDEVGGGSGSSVAPELSTPASGVPTVVVAAGVLVVGVLVAVLLLRNRSSTELNSPATSRVGESEPELGGAREAPDGRLASDRFADADASNPVYQAWREMATSVDGADLRTHTPGEVASRAVDAGMDREAVSVLTDLFDEVRYGRQGVDEEFERRARSALDAISAGEEA